MGRTRLDRAVAKLKKEIQTCENYKKRILNYVEKIKDKHLSGDITYYEYEQLIQRELQGKKIQEWLDIYDSYIKKCEKNIKKEIRKFKTKKVLLIFSSIVLISLILFSAFYLRPILIGLVTENAEEPEPRPAVEESLSEEIQEEAFQEDSSPSQEEPSTSEQSEEPTEPEEIPTEEPIEPEPTEELPEEIPENITEPEEEIPEEIPENITEPEISENITIPKEILENITEPEKEIPEETLKNITEPEIPKNITPLKNITEINISLFEVNITNPNQ